MTMDLAKFAKTIVQEGPWDGSNLDGGWVQDLAEKYGIITKTAYDPEKHGESEYAEPGDAWYEFSDEFTAALSTH